MMDNIIKYELFKKLGDMRLEWKHCKLLKIFAICRNKKIAIPVDVHYTSGVIRIGWNILVIGFD